MKGYVTHKGTRWYAVIYEGLDLITGRERLRWHPAGTSRDEAECLAARLSKQRNGRDGQATKRAARAPLEGHRPRHRCDQAQPRARVRRLRGDFGDEHGPHRHRRHLMVGRLLAGATRPLVVDEVDAGDRS